MRVTIERLPVRADARGISFDAVDPGGLASWGAMHAVVTLPGNIRGNHSHADADELLVVAGTALVRLRDRDETRDVEVADGEVVRFTIPRGVAHAVLARGEAPQLLIAMNSIPSPQTERVVLIEPGATPAP